MTVAAAMQYDAVGRAFSPPPNCGAWAKIDARGRHSQCCFHETSEALAPKTALMPRFIAHDHPSFPASLRSMPRPSPGLWFQGRLPLPTDPLLAIVGSRAASVQGCGLASQWAAAVAAAGHAIVSGGALGIDAAAHEGALAAGGATYAVLGCGADVVYPDRHGPLFARIAQSGGLVSEYPPGTLPRPGQFPVRNRLIVGLAQTVLVVEARLRSGALVTARLAHKQGRRLLAVPGTAGTDALLQSNMAWAVQTESDLFLALSGHRPATRGPAQPSEAVAPVVSAIQAGKHTPAAMALFLGQALGDVMAALMEAELEGWVRRGAGSQYEVNNGH